MPSKVVSSAYMIGQKRVLAVAKSLMYIMNSNGPRIETCGTPVVNVSKGYSICLNSTYYCICIKY